MLLYLSIENRKAYKSLKKQNKLYAAEKPYLYGI